MLLLICILLFVSLCSPMLFQNVRGVYRDPIWNFLFHIIHSLAIIFLSIFLYYVQEIPHPILNSIFVTFGPSQTNLHNFLQIPDASLKSNSASRIIAFSKKTVIYLNSWRRQERNKLKIVECWVCHVAFKQRNCYPPREIFVNF